MRGLLLPRLLLSKLLLLAALIGTSATAEPPVFTDDKLAARYSDLIAELRCVVCQNQSLAESNVPLAKDLRTKVAEQLKAGQSDRQIKDYLVSRYGEFVLYSPRFSWRTLFLWLLPPLLLLGGFFAILKSRRKTPVATLSAQEQQRLNNLLQRPITNNSATAEDNR